MAIIYSYPPNINILPTDILVCTNTALVGGRPKNQTKSMSIADLTTSITTNAGNNLNTVLLNGNTSLLDAKIGELKLYDLVAAVYGGLKLNNSEFILVDQAGPAVKLTKNNIFFSDIVVGMGGGNIDTNTAVGYRALADNTSGNQNTAIGGQTLRNNIIGYKNVAVGEGSLKNYIGNEQTAVGHASLQENTTGIDNTAVGTLALNENLVGGGNTAVGIRALTHNLASNNTAVGRLALRSNTTGFDNVAVGESALLENINGYGNIAIGKEALFNATGGIYNTVIGTQAFAQLGPVGSYSVAIGYFSCNNAYLSNYATGVGAYALENNRGENNVGVGAFALNKNNVGFNNTAIGTLALEENRSGDNNVAIGYNALSQEELGNDCIGIGRDCRMIGAGVNNAIVIGADARGNGTNTTVIGNDLTTKAEIRGELALPELRNFPDDASAAAGGVVLKGLYHTVGVVKIRLV